MSESWPRARYVVCPCLTTVPGASHCACRSVCLRVAADYPYSTCSYKLSSHQLCDTRGPDARGAPLSDWRVLAVTARKNPERGAEPPLPSPLLASQPPASAN